MIETEKVNKLLPNIPTGNITEINEPIYAWVKLVGDKIGITLRNPNKLQNLDDKWRTNKEAATKRESAKERITHNDIMGWKDQSKTANKSDNTT